MQVTSCASLAASSGKMYLVILCCFLATHRGILSIVVATCWPCQQASEAWPGTEVLPLPCVLPAVITDT